MSLASLTGVVLSSRRMLMVAALAAVTGGCLLSDPVAQAVPDGGSCGEPGQPLPEPNCGQCGVVCDGDQVCYRGECIVDTSVAGPQQDAREIASDGTHVYWLTYGGDDALGNYQPGAIMRMSLDGSGIETVVPAVVRGSSLLVDDTQIYWVADGVEVWRAPKADPNGRTGLATASWRWRGLWQNQDQLFTFDAMVGGIIQVVNKSDWSLTTIDVSAQTTFPPSELVVSSTHLYWNENDDQADAPSMWRVAVDGGTAAESLRPAYLHYGDEHFAVDHMYLYGAFSQPSVISRFPLAGGDSQNLLLPEPDEGPASAFVLTGDGIFVSTSDCELIQVPLEPGASTSLFKRVCALEMVRQNGVFYWVSRDGVHRWSP